MNQPAMSSNARQVAVDLLNHGAVVRERAHVLTVRTGAAVQTQAKANASGRPGPRAPTGDFRRKIRRQTVRHVHVTTTYIGTDMPQGRRLEFGFGATAEDAPGEGEGKEDVKGRVYHQPPYPWLHPAFDKYASGFEEALGDLAVSE